MKNIFITTILLSICVSCKQDIKVEPVLPISDFIVTFSDGFAPHEVNVVNKSLNATSYKWNFGNGETSNLQYPPRIVYSNEGIFPLTLTAINKDGSHTSTKNIIVRQRPRGVRFKYVKITNFPEKNGNGEYWRSPYTGPDVFFKIKNSSETLFEFPYQKRKVNLKKTDLPYTFSGFFYEIHDYDFKKVLGIELLDYNEDLNPPQRMMGLVKYGANFNSMIADGTLPVQLNLSGSSFSCIVGLEWLFW